MEVSRSTVKAPLLVVLVMGLVAALIPVGLSAGSPAAAAPSGSQFDPGFIISDSNFFDAAAMNEQQVQQFLQSRVPTCADTAGLPCLKDYSEATISRPPVGTNHCGPYQGSAGERASTIIVKVAQACNINPRVLLATLQKERGLVTKTSPTASDYRVAMGYGCPDTAPCATEYFGFANQMYLAARQFRQYTLRPSSYNYRIGVENVQFHPNAACGSSPISIRNQATANLYNYTPYQPNAAALRNLEGTGDGCSSYGNRNFWNYYYSWFGNPAVSADPRASLDDSSVVYTPDSALIHLRGWALDPAAIAKSIEVHVYLTAPDGSVRGYPARADSSRPDVGAAFPGAGPAHGFVFDIPAQSTGSHRSCIYLMRSAGPVLYGCQFFVVTQDAPSGSVDGISVNLETTPGSLDVRGWAIDDINPTRAADVHVYVRGPRGSLATYVVPANISRPDVGSAFPAAGARHGFALTAPFAGTGTYQVCVYAIGTPLAGANNATIGCSQIVFGPSAPVGALDEVTVSRTSASKAISLRGWTLDNSLRARATEAHVYVTAPDGITTGRALPATQLRSDIAQAFPGAGAGHGFSTTIPVSTDGVYRVCVYGIGARAFGDASTVLQCRDVPVGVGRPRGALDSVVADATRVTVTGWAIDESLPAASTDVHLYVTDPRGSTVGYPISARLPRPDVAAAVVGAGPNHGFAYSVPRTIDGSYTICAYAIAAPEIGTGNVLLACRRT